VKPTSSTDPLVTIVVVPRERFSYTQESLESIYAHTKPPFQLVYVDGNSPAPIRQYLETGAREKGFKLVRHDQFLTPNQARNIGLREAPAARYIVFCDNDVVVTDGWLEALVECAEETGATAVGPLTCQGTPIHETIHCAGGETGIKTQDENGQPVSHIIEKMYRQGRKVQAELPTMKREQTGLAEFHCVLVRKSFFDEVLPQLDEGFMNTKEHVDMCMEITKSGGTIYFEPESLITYIFNRPLETYDLHYYMLRWSDAWEHASLRHMQKKWGLSEDEYFKGRFKNQGWRRKMAIIRPLCRKITGKQDNPRFEKLLSILDLRLNRIITDRHARRVGLPASATARPAAREPAGMA
jgi:GT2 family glycosyltransferase